MSPNRRLSSMLAFGLGLAALSVSGPACVPMVHLPSGGYVLSQTARTGASAVVVGDRIYLAGGQTLDDWGKDGGSFLSSVVSAPLTAQGIGDWREETALPVPRGYSTLLAHQNALYLVGGFKDNSGADSGVMSGVLRAELKSDGSLGPWTELAKDIGVTRGGAAITNNALFVAGGISRGGSATEKVLRLGLDAQGTPQPAIFAGELSYARNRYALVSSPYGLYALGGYRGGIPFAYDDSVERVMWSEGGPQVWSQAEARMPARRAGHAAVRVGDRLIVTGGFDGTRYLDRIDVGLIDPNSGRITSWVQAGTLKAARADHVMVVHGDSLLLLGGGNGEGVHEGSEQVSLSALSTTPTAAASP